MYAGVALSYKEQGPKGDDKPDTRAQFRAVTARMAALYPTDSRSGLRYPPGSKEAEERRMMDQAINAVVDEAVRWHHDSGGFDAGESAAPD